MDICQITGEFAVMSMNANANNYEKGLEISDDPEIVIYALKYEEYTYIFLNGANRLKEINKKLKNDKIEVLRYTIHCHM
jgi:hypothetical protein